MLFQAPNHQNCTCSVLNPHEVSQRKLQGDVKAMYFVAIAVRILAVFWFRTEAAENVSVNGECYLEMVQTAIHQAIQELEMETGKQYWLQRGGTRTIPKLKLRSD